MNIFLYDRTFEGFLSAVFYAYDTKIFPDKIIGTNLYQDDFFAEKYSIYTNEHYAHRVWKGILRKTSKQTGQKVYRAFLSELEGVEMQLFRFIDLCFNSGINIETDYSNDVVLQVDKIYKKVCMEGHRAIMFLRFQKTRDGIYYAPFEPAYNVLPLTLHHLKDRFSDQQWVIYDTKRNYGFYYDLEEVSEIRMDAGQLNAFNGNASRDILSDTELNFQELWNDYFQSVNIKERKNPKVHKQFLPKRFWKYLPEKNFIR